MPVVTAYRPVPSIPSRIRICVSRVLPLDHRPSHKTSSSAATHRSVCSTTPVVMRTQPSHPGWVDRSRMKMRRPASARTTCVADDPTRTRTKFASLRQYVSPRRSAKA